MYTTCAISNGNGNVKGAFFTANEEGKTNYKQFFSADIEKVLDCVSSVSYSSKAITGCYIFTYGDVAISADVDLDETGLFIGGVSTLTNATENDSKITLSKDAVLTGTVKAVETTNALTYNEIEFEGLTAGNGGVTLEAGSIVIGGEIVETESSITVVSGEAELAADIPAGMTVTISEGASLEVPTGESIANNGTLVNEGTLTVTGSLANNASIVNAGTIESKANISGNKPAEMVDGTLTLDNFEGSYSFDGSFTKVILIGDNKITLEDAEYALKSSAAFEIKSVDGIGSLEIVMNATDDFTGTSMVAISSEENNGKVTINGVPVAITMTGTPGEAYAIKAKAGFSAYDATLVFSVCEESYTAESQAAGIYSGEMSEGTFTPAEVSISSSVVSVSAGYVGIAGGEITIAASVVGAEASELGIYAKTSLLVSNASTVGAGVLGLSEESSMGPYGIITPKMNSETDSVITTDGMCIYGTGSVNNATVINEGDMVVLAGADYTNKGSFTNNGTIGVYGTFTNSAGEFVNYGAFVTYGYKDGELKDSATLAVDQTTTETGITAVGTISVVSIMPMADGTFKVVLTIAAKSDTNTSTFANTKFYGTLTYSSEDGYSIDASTESGAQIAITCNSDASKYTVYVGGTVVGDDDKEYTFQCDIDETTEKSANTKYSLDFSKIRGLVAANEASALTITGGVFTNASALSAVSIAITDGEFDNSGLMSVKKLTMSKGVLTGNDIVVVDGGSVELAGVVNIAFNYSGEYTATSGTVEFDDTISVVGEVKAVKFETGSQGEFVITSVGDADSDSAVIVEEGKAVIGKSSATTPAVGSKMVLEVLSGAALSVYKSATVSATSGVIAVQDGATFNAYVFGLKETYSYGKVDYTTAFENEGYTY